MEAILLLKMPCGWELLMMMIVFGVSGILWLIALIDCLRSNFSGDQKLIWVLVIILVPLLGAILYLIMGRNDKVKN